MRLTTLRRLLLKILSLSLLCAVELFGISENGRAQNSSPMRLSLSQAIDMAIKENRDLKLARLAVTDGEHKREIARSAYFPHIKNESSVLHLTICRSAVSSRRVRDSSIHRTNSRPAFSHRPGSPYDVYQRNGVSPAIDTDVQDSRIQSSRDG